MRRKKMVGLGMREVPVRLVYKFSANPRGQGLISQSEKTTLELSLLVSVPHPITRRRDALAALRSQYRDILRTVLAKDSSWQRRMWSMPASPSQTSLHIKQFRQMIGRADVYINNNKILAPETDLTGDTVVDGLQIKEVGKPLHRFVGVTLSDGTHRLMSWEFEKGWRIFKFPGGGVVSKKALERFSTAPFLPTIQFDRDRKNLMLITIGAAYQLWVWFHDGDDFSRPTTHIYGLVRDPDVPFESISY